MRYRSQGQRAEFQWCKESRALHLGDDDGWRWVEQEGQDMEGNRGCGRIRGGRGMGGRRRKSRIPKVAELEKLLHPLIENAY